MLKARWSDMLGALLQAAIAGVMALDAVTCCFHSASASWLLPLERLEKAARY